jgi:hypothetical protein
MNSIPNLNSLNDDGDQNTPASITGSLTSSLSTSLGGGAPPPPSPSVIQDPSKQETIIIGTQQKRTKTSERANSPKHGQYRVAKQKFSQDDDDLLINLKEVKKLTWKQIAEHFNGRTAGALQVRYCTKLKARASSWSDDDLDALRDAVQQYDNDKWSVVSQKLGGKYTPTLCREKYKQLRSFSSSNINTAHDSGGGTGNMTEHHKIDGGLIPAGHR